MALPLEGIRVIDVGTRISAPFCAGLLGEQGAEVIKVEDPKGGDFMRTIGPFADGYSLFWAVEGRGRKSVTCNLRVPEGQELFRRLCATADVVCENFRPGTMEAWNVGPSDLDPRLVYVAISAPLDNYPTADGRYVCIVAGSDANFARLCKAMGRPELVDDERFRNLEQRAAHGDVINGLVEEWTSSLPATEIEKRCVEHDV